jgi:hypothetical protein
MKMMRILPCIQHWEVGKQRPISVPLKKIDDEENKIKHTCAHTHINK